MFEGCAGDKFTKIGNKIWVHLYHRYCLIPAYKTVAKLNGPLDLMLFDAHTDACQPGRVKDRGFQKKIGTNTYNINDVCENNLAKSDDDWIVAGMELNLIKDAYIFGIKKLGQCEPETIIDKANNLHKLYYFRFGNNTYHSDWSVCKSFADVIKNDNKLKKFILKICNKKTNSIWLNFDLDCFTKNSDCIKFIQDEDLQRIFFTKELKCIAHKSKLITVAKTMSDCQIKIDNMVNKLVNFCLDKV